MDEKNFDPVEKENEDELDPIFYPLTDEDGNEMLFELIASAEIEGTMYYAMIPVDEQSEGEAYEYEYVLLKGERDENGEEYFVSIDDEDEEEDIAEFFDDLLSNEADYDVAAPGEADPE